MNTPYSIRTLVRQGCLTLLLLFTGLSLVVAQDTLTAYDDSYVHGGFPDRNYGSRTNLRVHSWGPAYSFVRFNVAGLVGRPLDYAVLVINVLDVKAPGTLKVHLVTEGWWEDSLTFNNQPSFEGPVRTVPITPEDAGGTVSVNIRSIVEQWTEGWATNYGLAFTNDGINVTLGSVEGGAPMAIEFSGSPIRKREKTRRETLVPCELGMGECTVALGIDCAGGEDVTGGGGYARAPDNSGDEKWVSLVGSWPDRDLTDQWGVMWAYTGVGGPTEITLDFTVYALCQSRD